MESDKTLETLLYLTTKQFNLSEDEAKTLLIVEDKLREDAADVILEKDKQRIAKLKAERETKYNEGYQTAEKKFKTHAEEVFKKKTGYTGIEDNFEAMFDAWYERTKLELKGKKEINEDDIKKHPLFIDLETKSIPKEKYDELQRSFDEFKTQSQRQQVMDVVTSRAWNVIATRNPILSENPLVAENRKRDFLSKFSGYGYELQDDRIIVLKDGKRIEDAHGNLKTFEAFTNELGDQHFDFRVQDYKENGGNRNQSGTVVVTENPKTEFEYFAALDKYNSNSEEDMKKRIAIKKRYFENIGRK